MYCIKGLQDIHNITHGQLTAIIAPLLMEALQAATYLLGKPTHT